MTTLTYPAPFTHQPSEQAPRPTASVLGNLIVACLGCPLWHEVPGHGRIDRITCACGRTVWQATRPRPHHSFAALRGGDTTQ